MTVLIGRNLVNHLFRVVKIYPVGRLSTVLRGLLILLLTVIFLISVNKVRGSPCKQLI